MKNKEVVNLEEVRLAKQLRRDVPEIKKLVDNFLVIMIQYNEYIDVQKIVRQSQESVLMLETLEAIYSTYLPKKGKK